jgi:hypothetical protein
MMRHSVIKNFRCGLCILLLLAAIHLPAGDCLAQERRSEGRILPKYYPANFSGHGCINRIEGDEVVIDDMLFRFAPDATFHTPKSQYSSRASFRKGVRVGFISRANKKIESLWYIDMCRYPNRNRFQ